MNVRFKYFIIGFCPRAGIVGNNWNLWVFNLMPFPIRWRCEQTNQIHENVPGASSKSSDTKPVEYLSFSAPHPAMKQVFPSITGSAGSDKQAGLIVGES